MSARWMRRVLGLAPRAFREKYEEELLTTYAEREQSAVSRGRRVAFQLRELWGALLLVTRLRLGLGAEPGPRGLDRAGERSWPAAAWQDSRFAARTLLRSPGFALAAVLVLGVGIGATSAIFSAVNAYFFRPLPFTDPDRLVTVFETNPEFGWTDQTASPANLLDWRERVDLFEDVSGYLDFGNEVTLYRDGEPIVLAGTAVLGNFFSTLGAVPSLGRTFRFEETWSDAPAVVVLSHDAWVTLFGADPEIVGRSIELANGSPEVVGVMPEGFRFPDDDVQIWMPAAWNRAALADASFRRAHFVRAFARLAPGVAIEEADAELQSVVRSLQEEYPETNRVMGAGIMEMRAFLTRDVRAPLGVLLGAGALLLLLACANVANLQLVRASERGRELSLRRALGAGRVRLVRQMLIESALLALAGGALGLALGWIGIRSVDRLTSVGIEGATSLALDHRIVLFTLAAAALSAVLFGVAPALKAAWAGTDGIIPSRARGSSAGRDHLRAAGTLVSVQLALSLLLATGAGLMVRSFWLLGRVDPGFDAEGVLAVQVPVQSVRYPERDLVLAFYDRLVAGLEARPGVERAGVIGQLPLAGPNWSSQFQAEGWPPDRVGFEILHRRADRGYFEALHIPLVRGRLLEPGDRPGSPLAVVVNEAFVREHFPGEDPIGQRIAYTRNATPESTWYEIVGVVGDQRQEHLARPARPEVFESRYQDWGRNDWVVIRGEGEPLDLLPLVREVLDELDPLIPIGAVRPLASVREASIAQEQLVLRLLGAFGATALLLATVGVYAVTSRAARRRTQEIGIRMALGAAGGDVLRMMLRQGLGVIVVGLAVGLAGALLATRALGSLLYGVEPNDPLTLAAVVALLGFVALVASWVPARRAAAVDPLSSLRSE
ncbi:MAG: ABC transporter permease [Gemmatimonadales bacterium]